jgi:NADPH-dependent 2,4-dienoyl-CoA reductase/sulfur reductase-like enzyme/nitrite reductase/ring-hydroxylating ferredoxin subunit
MNTRHVIAKTDELQDGQMKEIEVGDRTFLLVRVDGQYHCYPGQCPHHGAPLAEGLLCDDHIRCPWHQAVFDARTGEFREPPATDDLPEFETQVDDENVVLLLPEDAATLTPPDMATPSAEEDAREVAGTYVGDSGVDALRQYRNFVILGAGAAGLAAAEAMRHQGYRGNITLLTGEDHLPYDRTDLSKRYLQTDDADPPFLRSREFCDRYGIVVLTGSPVVEADLEQRTIRCGDGADMSYDRLLIATGCRPRTLGIDGEDLEGVHTLRSLDDCQAIKARARRATEAVVVGASFIGMEVAASLTERGVHVTVVAPESEPFERTFGPEIGRMYRQVQQAKGTTFRMGTTCRRFEGLEGTVQSVVLDDQQRLDADLVVVGVGVEPVTDYLRHVDVNEDGSLSVDEHLAVRGSEDVFAAGDVARFLDWRTGTPIRIEHWRLAQQLGRLAGANMLGRQERYEGTPFFWTNQHMVITDMVGHVREPEEIRIEGNLDDQDFLAWFLRDGHVWAAAGCGRAKDMCSLGEMLREPHVRSVQEVREMARRRACLTI